MKKINIIIILMICIAANIQGCSKSINRGLSFDKPISINALELRQNVEEYSGKWVETTGYINYAGDILYLNPLDKPAEIFGFMLGDRSNVTTAYYKACEYALQHGEAKVKIVARLLYDDKFLFNETGELGDYWLDDIRKIEVQQ